MNTRVVKIGPNVEFRYVNFRPKDQQALQQEMNNSRYEGYMRGDFRTPNVDRFTYDQLLLVINEQIVWKGREASQ